jgi:uncharacterized membrane protein
MDQISICAVCRAPHPAEDMVRGEIIRDGVADAIRRALPGWSRMKPVCLSCLDRFRNDHVRALLGADRGELSALEEEVLRSLREHEILSHNVEVDQRLTLGQRVADRVAMFGGSWTFILSFGAVLLLWVAVNSGVLLARPFDPYPYILLNLVLSCLAALQAPIIMMSQNRQETRDRLRAEHDCQVNLKAELEIRQLTWRMDQLLHHQWRRLLEVQQIQTDLLAELLRRRAARGPS